MRIAITGGIGSGKSYVSRLLHEHGIRVFDCDTVAKHIIATDPEVSDQLTALIGQPLTKAALGNYIRRGHDYAARVNAIVHPRVAQAFERHCEDEETADGGQHHWMECAILLESGFDRLVDCIVVVTCPLEERIRRITARDHCDRVTAQRWINLQTSDEERIAHADHIIINDGSTPLLPQLAVLLAEPKHHTP